MSSLFPQAKMSDGPSPQWEDRDLVQACLNGDQRAWDALIQKYKKLIYSVPMRYRLPPDAAADIFQAVCLDLYTELDRLRAVEALRGWLARVAANKCYHWKRRDTLRKEEGLDPTGEGHEFGAEPTWVAQIERDQLVREAIGRLQPRCQELIRMLFFEDEPRPYEDVARDLGLATGSIGFIRGRCLKKLTQALEELGL